MNPGIKRLSSLFIILYLPKPLYFINGYTILIESIIDIRNIFAKIDRDPNVFVKHNHVLNIGVSLQEKSHLGFLEDIKRLFSSWTKCH